MIRTDRGVALRQPGAAHEALAAEREAETDREAGG
jgi:hypothetical protein